MVEGMYCPFCNYADTKVIDSRLTVDNSSVKRESAQVVDQDGQH